MGNKNNHVLNVLLQKHLEAEKDLTEKQKDILEAAVEIFCEKGFAATATSEIAKRAGVAEGTIFRHYKTKKNLLFSIVSPAILNLSVPIVLKDIEDILKKPYGSFEDFLSDIVNSGVELIERNQAVLKIITQEAPYHPELRLMVKETFEARIASKIKYAIEYFQGQDEVAMLPVRTITGFIFSTIAGYAVMRFQILPDQQWDDEAEIEIMIGFLLRGLKAF